MSPNRAQASLCRSVSVAPAGSSDAAPRWPDCFLRGHGDLSDRKWPLEGMGDRIDLESRRAFGHHSFPALPIELCEGRRRPRLVSECARVADRLGHHRPLADACCFRVAEDERERLRPPRRPGVDGRQAYLRRGLPQLHRITRNTSARPPTSRLHQARSSLTPLSSRCMSSSVAAMSLTLKRRATTSSRSISGSAIDEA